MDIKKIIRRPEIRNFVMVGSAAAAVHFCMVLFLVQTMGWDPIFANAAAFLIAFNVSYFGHRFLTFADTTLTHAESLARFFMVAIASFCLNEVLYYVLLRYTSMPYWLSLGLVLVIVAVITFISSRLWAFRKNY